MARLALLVSMVLIAAACGGSSDSSPAVPTWDSTAQTVTTPTTERPVSLDPPATAATTTAATTTLPPVEPVLGAQLAGRWAHYDVVAYEDGILKTLIISYGFNTFEEVDGQMIDSTEFCFSEQRTDQPIETALSDAATQAIKPPDTPLEIDLVDGELRVQRAATPTPVGIRLDDPANESLPTDPADPRIVDDDGDGNPGITVTISVSADLTGELYIARREIFAYEVTLDGPHTLRGLVTDGSEQLVIGASDPVFNVGSDWTQFPDLAKSPIILKRVEANWDCSQLAAARDDLFPPTPEVDW